MKPKLEPLHLVADTYRYHGFELTGETFPFFWHYHPEYELTLIISGYGNRLVGDNYQPFGPGDWVLLGPDIPHTWTSAPDSQGVHRALVLQFSREWALRVFLKPEFQAVHDLLARAGGGLKFPSADAGQHELLAQAIFFPGTKGLLACMQVLEQLSRTKAMPISEFHLPQQAHGNTRLRLETIIRYVQESPASATLTRAAEAIHLSESALCKLFKRHMGRTFSDYVNQVRISRASALLIQTDLPVNQVASQAGYENMAYFNRVFLKAKGVPPRQYRQSVRKNQLSLHSP